MAYPYNLNSKADYLDVRNFATTQTIADISAAGTTIVVANGDKLPSGRFIALLGGAELIVVSGRVGTNLTVVERGAYGTTAAVWLANTQISGIIAAEHIEELHRAVLKLQAQGWAFQPPVLTRDNNPPLAPTEGDRHLVGPLPTGFWASNPNNIAIYDGAFWRFIAPLAGFQTYVQNEGLYAFNGVEWEFAGASISTDANNDIRVGSDGKLFADNEVVQVANEAALIAVATKDANTLYIRRDTNQLYRYNGGTAGTIADFAEVSPDDAIVFSADETEMLTRTKANGVIYVTTDTGNLYRYNGGTAGTIADFTQLASDLVQLDNFAAIDGLAAKDPNVLYLAKDTNRLYRWDGANIASVAFAPDEFIQAADLAALDALPSKNAAYLYLAVDTGNLYRWDGAAFIQIGGAAGTSTPLFIQNAQSTLAWNGNDILLATLTVPNAGQYEITVTGNLRLIGDDTGALVKAQINGADVPGLVYQVSALDNTAASGFDEVYGGSASMLVTLNAGDVVTLVGSETSGATQSDEQWLTVKELPTAQLIPASAATVNDQAASGYFDIGTMRVQWGRHTTGGSNPDTVVLPAPFANDQYSVVAQYFVAGGPGPIFASVAGLTATQFQYSSFTSSTGAAAPRNAMWQAIGLKP